MPDTSKFSMLHAKVIPFLRTKNGKIIAGIIIAVLALIFIMHNTGSGKNTIDGVATQQLQDIQNGNFDKAYALTSSAFQRKNSLDVFTGYVQSNTILKDYTDISFTENKVDNDVGTLKATLTGADNMTAEVDWQLVQENHQWKVQVFQINNPQAGGAASIAAGASDSSGAVIHDLLIGDQADLDGYVDSAKSTLSSSAPKIFVTAEIVIPANSPGSKIQAILHMPGLMKNVSPQTSQVTGTGNILKPFAFLRNGNAWPTGDYSITVTLSTGATLTQKFKVE